jgi:hypothetical protein
MPHISLWIRYLGNQDRLSFACHSEPEPSDSFGLWSRIKSEGMPDAAKFDQPSQMPRCCELPPGSMPDPSALANLLDQWMHGDEAEQQETFAVLCRSLDEDRPEGYKLFS